MVERILFCPRCNSSNIHPYIGGMTGSYHCLDCGYLGSLVIQKDFVKSMDEEDVLKKKPAVKSLNVKKYAALRKKQIMSGFKQKK
ncbi:MAG: hypothetical protein V1743_06615 [Nanoarchaeota archaeon]